MTGLEAVRPVQRHRIERIDGAEQLRIPFRAGRWTPLWAVVALALAALQHGSEVRSSLQAMESGSFGVVDMLFMAFWIAILLMAVQAAIVGNFGSEILAVSGTTLRVRKGFGPFGRTWRYDASGIRDLVSSEGEKPAAPFFKRDKSGGVMFEYEGKSIYLAPGVDEAEGEAIMRWLRLRLPLRAADMAQR